MHNAAARGSVYSPVHYQNGWIYEKWVQLFDRSFTKQPAAGLSISTSWSGVGLIVAPTLSYTKAFYFSTGGSNCSTRFY